MSDELDESTPARRSLMSRMVFGSPRNLFLTVCVIIVLANMANSSFDRNKELDEKKVRPASATYPNVDAEGQVILPAPGRVTEESTPKAAVSTSQIDVLNSRLEALEAKLKVTEEGTKDAQIQSAVSEAALNQISNTQDAIAVLDEKIAGQEKTIEMLNQQLHNVARLREEMAAMQDRSSQKLASIALFSQLRETASRGASFKTMLDPLLELNKANPKTNALLLQLLPVATTGLHSAEELQKQFTTALDATLQRDKGSSFAHNLAKLIRIRKIGEQTGNDDESILARTEKAVAAQDLPAAIKHLDTLSTEAKKLMAPWVRAAQEHLNAQSTLTALQLSLASDETPAREAKEEPVSEIAAEAKIEAPKTETPATETDPLPAPEAVIPDSKPDKPEEDKVAE